MQKNINEILDVLDYYYADAKCELNFDSPYQLLVAVILSAQCTDKRVNIISKKLFAVAPTPEKMLKLGEEKLKEIIKPCGFFNNKAKSIISATSDIINKFNGELPSSREELESLKGVGRKTANVVLAENFNQAEIAVDTHVLRLSKRLNLTSSKATPYKCETDLIKLIPKEKRVKFHHQMIWFGRYKCKAIKPDCVECKMQKFCKYYKGKK